MMNRAAQTARRGGWGYATRSGACPSMCSQSPGHASLSPGHPHHPHHPHRHRGTVMTETVLVLPMLMLILSLIFYFGRVVVRTQHASVMARYETWRDVADAPGPQPTTDAENHPQLNSAFFADQAQSLQRHINDRAFPTDTLDEVIGLAQSHSADAQLAAESILYRPPSDTPRLPHGHREGFTTQYDTNIPLWRRIDGPFQRRHVLMNNDWRYVIDWRACADGWPSSATGAGMRPHHARGVRDAFFADLDTALDAVDGDTDPEYGDYDDGPQQFDGQILAGFIRSLYLHEPAYRGPIVHDERP